MKAIICMTTCVVATLALCAPGALAAGEWLKVGAPISEAEGPQAMKDQGKFTVIDLMTGVGELLLECSGTFTGTVGPGVHGRIEQLLTPGEAKVGEAAPELALLCKGGKACEVSATDVELWIRKLAWATKIEIMGVEPLRLNDISEEGNGFPAFLFACLVANIKVEDECKWELTSVALSNSSPSEYVRRQFDWKAPISSEAGNCTLGGAGAGVLEGEGEIRLVGGAILTIN